jgi:hypothetical protein
MKRGTKTIGEDLIAEDVPAGRSERERQNDLFMALARSAGNSEHVATLDALANRLEPVRRLEEKFLDHTEAETDDIVRALRTRDQRALRNSLARYHRRREQIVPQLVSGLLEDQA